MGRRKKQTDIEESIADQALEQQRLNSELTDDERRALTYHWKRDYTAALQAKKDADAALKNICKKAKAELGKGAVADIKALIALETPEGETEIKTDIERQLRVARWAGAPVGTQFQFFDNSGPAEDQAFENGKVAGFNAKDCAPPYDPSVPQYKRWIEGWQAAQEVLASGFAKTKQDVEGADVPESDMSDVPFRPADMPDAPAMPA